MLATVHRARGFLQVQARAPNGQGPLEAVAAVTSACIGAGGIAEKQTGSWAAEASDMLLDTWVELLYEHSAGFAKYGCLTLGMHCKHTDLPIPHTSDLVLHLIGGHWYLSDSSGTQPGPHRHTMRD